MNLGGHETVFVYGPGDLVPLVQDAPVGQEVVPVDLSWSVHAPGSLVVLDDSAFACLARWPILLSRLLDSAVTQLDQLGVETAATTLPRVEDRILWFLWLLAARFGRVTADGVLLPLRFTHQRLAEIIGARRPTISLALGWLTATGAIAQPRRDAWLLTAPAPGSIEPEIADRASGAFEIARPTVVR